MKQPRLKLQGPLLTAVLLLSSSPLWGQVPGASSPQTPLPTDPEVITGTLENGLRYFVRENDRPENRAELRLVVNVGSVLEDEDQRGLAHLLEHMAFNGTENFEKQELVEYLEAMGMNFGPEVNAYTSFDETVYMLRIPTDDSEIMDTAFQILEDWAHLISLEGEEIDKERGVVIEEWRLGRGAAARMADLQYPILFQGSRYAQRLPIGDVETLRTFPHESLRRFYRDWYRPNLMAVVAVGDFDGPAVEERIRRQFSSLENPSPAREREVFQVPPHEETLFAIASDEEATSSQVAILYKQPVRERSTVEGYRRILTESLITAMLNARLFELTQEQDPPFAAAGTGKGRFVRTSGFFQLGALVSDGGIQRGMTAVLTEAERVARHGFLPSELEREKVNLLRSLEQAFDERENQPSARYAGEYVSHFLEGQPIPGIEYEYKMAESLLPGVTIDDVNRTVADWLSGDNRVVMVNSPEKEGLPVPTEEELSPVFQDVLNAELEPWEDTTPDEPLMSRSPTPGSVVEESFIPELGITNWVLSNGLRVVLKPTDFKEDEVLFQAFSPGGYSLSRVDDHLSAANADQVVALGGVGDFNMVQLQRKLAGRAVSVSPSIGQLSEGFSGRASAQDLETLFQLVHLYVTAPRKDETAFSAMRSQMKALLDNRSNSPRAAFQDTIQVTLTQGHPRARPLTAEAFDEIDLERAFTFYQDRFADAGDFTFVFVGAFRPPEIRPLVETYLGSLPDLDRDESWRDLGIDPPEGIIAKEVRKGVEPQSETQIIFTGAFEYTHQNRLGIRILSSVLQTRLREVVREEMSGSYGVSVGRSYRLFPDPGYTIRISFGSDPERVEEIVAAIFREIRAFREAGPSAEDVEAAKEQARRAKEVNLRENSWWVTQLRYSYEEGNDPLLLLDDSRMEEVTPETIRRDAKLWLRLDNYVRVSLFPEAT